MDYPITYQYQEQEGIINTKEFKISQLITLKEYKTFLKETKDQVSKEEYTKLLPLSSCFTKEVYNRYLNTNEFDEYPVIAVTWYAAIQFCKWKTIRENEPGSIEFFYRLPSKYEWGAAYYFLNKLDAPHDFGKYYTDWSLNAYDESPHYFVSDINPVPIKEEIIPNEYDHPASKRRKILGTSYLRRQNYWNENGYYQYFDNSSPYLSFRCVKDENLWVIETSKTKYSKDKDSSKDSISTYLKVNPLIEYWGLEDLIYKSKKEQEEFEPVDVEDEKSSVKKISDGLTWSFYPYKIDKESGEPKNDIIPKYTGEYCGGQKCGDWYYFTKKGKLKKHYYFTKEGNKLTIEPPVEYPNVPDIDDIIAEGFYAYSNKLKDEQKDENKVVSRKNTSYEIQDGRLNGYFVYAKNDVQVAGRYNNNLKTGIWALWSNNKLIMVRDYNLGYEYKTIYSANPQNPLTLLLDNNPYSMQRNKDGYYDYYNLPERDVIWSKSIYRSLKEDQNPLLFNDITLLDIILEGATKGDFPVFKIDKFHDFGDSMTLAEVLSSYNPEEQEIASYIMKEIFFFDNERVIMGCRPIGFCPVVKNKITGKEKELFWVYLDPVRKSFSQISLQENKVPSYIKNLDDVFFFRYYGGSITGESNLYNNRRISEYVTGIQIEIEAQRIEDQLIDFEYETWGYFMGIKNPNIY
ncbi:MAG: SUMF1/EgtB/PvdO family nonheme iron enzyme [Bacteroidales bacterium]|nr:SUMF1/EgtB/PvdO family nonheme iron enzyme [Bacteroidales bacterium]